MLAWASEIYKWVRQSEQMFKQERGLWSRGAIFIGFSKLSTIFRMWRVTVQGISDNKHQAPHFTSRETAHAARAWMVRQPAWHFPSARPIPDMDESLWTSRNIGIRATPIKINVPCSKPPHLMGLGWGSATGVFQKDPGNSWVVTGLRMIAPMYYKLKWSP